MKTFENDCSCLIHVGFRNRKVLIGFEYSSLIPGFDRSSLRKVIHCETVKLQRAVCDFKKCGIGVNQGRGTCGPS